MGAPQGSLMVVVIMAVGRTATAGEPVVQHHRLENGLKILLYPSEDTNQVALVTLFSIGEDHDPAGKSGLAHTVEHVYITATAGEVPSRTVDEFMRRYPNAWNAQTGPDYTVFATVFPAAQLEAELREAAARMNDLRVVEADLEREKPRLLQELHNMFEGIPPLAASNHARESIRPSPSGHRKGGVSGHVQALTLQEVTGFWRDYYKPRNGILVLAGKFEPQAVLQLIEQIYGSIPAGKAAPAGPERGKQEASGLRFISIQPSWPAPGHACLGFAAPAPDGMHYVASLILISRMWVKSAANGGRPNVQFNLLDDPTFIAICDQLEKDEKPDGAIDRLRSFIDKSSQGPITPLDKLLAKNQLGIFLGMIEPPPVMLKQNLYGVAFAMGRREQLRISGAALADKLDQLNDADFKAASEAVFAASKQAAVVVQPKGNDSP